MIHSLFSDYRRSLLGLTVLIAGLAAGDVRAGVRPKGIEAEHGMVVSVSAPSSEVGLEILKKGGNAVDAAVATAFALAVTYPQAGNIGGGGFMVMYPASKKGTVPLSAQPVVIDYRETAPSAATKTMFSKDDSWYGHKVVGVPGAIRGLALAHRRFGKLPWKEVVRPAIRLAEDGFILGESLANSLNWIVCSSKEFPELVRVYGKDGGKSDWQDGDLLIQKDLAATLRLIAEEGPDAFYKGAIADKIAAEMKAGGGLITKADLAAYQAKERAPIHGTYRGYDIYGPPPPSSGGICLIEMLNILENFDLRKHDRFTPETLHLMIEAMRRAFHDRARYLGDADFIKIPARLTSKDYARTLAQGIDVRKATRSVDLAKEIPLAPEGDSTTHFSVIDKDGMAVANTFTLERSYGSRVVVRGAGFLLNDEMMDFNWRPGFTDRQGTIGTEPNQIAPGKRMLSSQTPTIVARDGRVVLITGSPGSRTIINTVLCVLVNVLDYEMDIRAAVDAPRLHHAWFPDVARFEGMREYAQAVERLRQMGHSVQGTRQGDAHSIWVDPKTGHYWGAEDHRISGKVASY
jgi:gamma-glutamyltranspeptidase/glutathione hydrolase